MGMGIVMRCVEMGWLLVEKNVTALLSAVTDIVYVCKTIHTTMRVGDALIVGMDVFDRILHGNDVPVPASVDSVDHAGQGGGLARSGGAGDQNQALLLLCQ